MFALLLCIVPLSAEFVWRKEGTCGTDFAECPKGFKKLYYHEKKLNQFSNVCEGTSICASRPAIPGWSRWTIALTALNTLVLFGMILCTYPSCHRRKPDETELEAAQHPREPCCIACPRWCECDGTPYDQQNEKDFEMAKS